MLIRFVAFPLGIVFIAIPFIGDDVEIQMFIMGPALGAIFLLYSIGGPSLLKNIGLARFARETKRPTAAEWGQRLKRTIISACVIGLVYLAIRWFGWIPAK